MTRDIRISFFLSVIVSLTSFLVCKNSSAQDTVSEVFTARAAEDGFVRGGATTIQSAPLRELVRTFATSNDGLALRVGDDSQNRQLKTILSFDTSGIPDDAEITDALIQLTRGATSGRNPIGLFGKVYVDIKSGGFGGSIALERDDFSATATLSHILDFSDSKTFTLRIPQGALAAIDPTLRTQFRLYLPRGTNGDNRNNIAGFYSKDALDPALHPQLIVSYRRPTTNPVASATPTTALPTVVPTLVPTSAPTQVPPSATPSSTPTSAPTETQTHSPTETPAATQSPVATPIPTTPSTPTATATSTATRTPTRQPTNTATPTPSSTPSSSSVWHPTPGTSWQWQLTGTIDTSFNVQMYDIDLFNTSQSTISALKARGIKVICYFSAGSYEDFRPDSASFPAIVLGNSNGWPGEKWLDIRRIDLLSPIMRARLDLAVQKGCDGVEPDNVDGFTNSTGFPLTSNDQLTFNRWLATESHARNLSVGLKNDLDQVAALVDNFDWALNEQCFQYNECGMLTPFVQKGKAVFGVEYSGQTSTFCPLANSMNFDWLKKSLNLDAPRTACR